MEAEFGTNNQYADNTVTGTDFKTVDPLKIKQTDDHFLYGEGTIDSFNKNGVSITARDVETMGSFLDPKTGTVNMNAVPLLRQNSSNINLGDGSLNTSPNSTPHMNGHLPSNAQYDAAAHELQALKPDSGKPDTFSSWHKGDIEYAPIKESLFAKFTKTIGVDPTSGFGTLVLGWKNKVKNFLRPGAKADKIVRESVPAPKTQPAPEAQPKAKSQPVPEAKPAQDEINAMLDKEYQIVHGHKPSETERARYKQLVQNEWKREETPPSDMGAYLQQRMDTFETMIGTAKEPLAESNQGLSDKYKDDINQARQRMWQLPQGERGTADVTLTDFRQHMAKCLSNDGQLRAEVSSKNFDSRKGPVGKIRENTPSH